MVNSPGSGAVAIVAWPSLSIEVTGGQRRDAAGTRPRARQPSGRRKADVARDVNLHARRQGHAPPQRARQPRFDAGFDVAQPRCRRGWSLPNLVERAPASCIALTRTSCSRCSRL